MGNVLQISRVIFTQNRLIHNISQNVCQNKNSLYVWGEITFGSELPLLGLEEGEWPAKAGGGYIWYF